MESAPATTNPAVFQTPEWVQDAVFYQIFPDRFARSESVPKPVNLETWDSPPTYTGFKGGDLVGVVENLDYLADLGITAIYFCPVFQSTANHRYHTHDYDVVDPILGGNPALSLLLEQAHRRGMRVILDGVFNHASRGFFQFSHILENGPQSPYIDWFITHNWPLHPYGPPGEPPNYDCWWNLPALPKFNTSTPAVREFLWSVGERWIERGIDGWRLDVPAEIDDDEFWQEFRRRVRARNKDAYLVGEIWNDARRWLQGDQFDGVMNYLFTRACIGFFAGQGAGVDHGTLEGTGLYPVEMLDASSFGESIDGLLRLYPEAATLAQLNLLSSHDMPRFLTIAQRDPSALRLSSLFQMTYPGAPCIYYGDEIGMEGGHDPDCRRGFPWDRSRWNEDLRDYIRRCVALRHTHAVLRRGSFAPLHAEGTVYIFVRELGEDVAIVALNAGQGSATVSLDAPIDAQHSALAHGSDMPEIVDGRIRSWNLAERSGSVIVGRRSHTA